MDAEHAERILAEVAYWQALLDDVKAINDSCNLIADDMANASVALISLVSLSDPRANEFVRDGMDATNAGMKHLMTIQDQVDSLLRVASGRSLALRAEAGA